MVYLAWLVVLLTPYWLGPIVVWLTQKAGARPVFEPFTPGRHSVPEDVSAAFRQTCDALATEGFQLVADQFQTGHRRPVLSCGSRSCGIRRGCVASNARTSSSTAGAESASRSSTRPIPPGSSGRRWCVS